MSEALVKNSIKEWLEQWVIGFKLCPFAAKPYLEKKVRIVVYDGDVTSDLLEMILKECRLLLVTLPDEIETTLIVCPQILGEFQDYWEFTGLVEDAMAVSSYEGILQVATFHPEYLFADSEEGDPSNFTNRAPFPVFHLLREDSLTNAIDNFPDIDRVPGRNIKFMRSLSLSMLRDQLASWQDQKS